MVMYTVKGSQKQENLISVSQYDFIPPSYNPIFISQSSFVLIEIIIILTIILFQ